MPKTQIHKVINRLAFKGLYALFSIIIKPGRSLLELKLKNSNLKSLNIFYFRVYLVFFVNISLPARFFICCYN